MTAFEEQHSIGRKNETSTSRKLVSFNKTKKIHRFLKDSVADNELRKSRFSSKGGFNVTGVLDLN
jgi:hypothetical protein